jgi:hypothetical protein
MKCLAVMFVVTGCGDNGDGPADASLPQDEATCVPGTPTTVFLNRAGGTYTPGPDNATTNTSSIINANTTIPAPTVVDAEWNEVVACVKSKFTAFAVDITETDPGTAPHAEMVMLDNPQQIGQSGGVGSLSPFTCDKVVNAVPFMMWGTVAQVERCWVIAQSIGSTFGLDHSFSCPDMMTFLTNCGPTADKTFTDAEVPCGEFEARACQCGGTTQNSRLRMLVKAGASCN